MRCRFNKRNPILDPPELIYRVKNGKNELLGHVIYDSEWKMLVWCQEDDIQMSADCLEEVVRSMKSRK